MNRLIAPWSKILSGEPIIGLRAQAIMVCLMIVGVNLGLILHRTGLRDFCVGAALPLAGILAIQTFRLKSVEQKADADESGMTELHLSR